MITVTRATSPPQETFFALVQQILATRNFTNHGPLVMQLEEALRAYLCPDTSGSITVCANGTLGLELALRANGLEGKRIITTSFTYVATLSAILAAGCTPVFVDIAPDTLCLTPESAESCLDDEVGAILPVHVYGNACDVEGFEALSRRSGIPVLYDAAHAFGVEYKGQSLFCYGDCAVASFHATKVFHTCEGGCVVSHSSVLQEKLRLIRAFGHVGDTHVMPGINAKMSELHAAMGLCMLPLVQEGIAARKCIAEQYDVLLASLPVQQLAWTEGLLRNYAYYPILFENEETLLAATAGLAAQDIVPRRYFYPALTTLPYVHEVWKRPCPVAEDVCKRVLCLPIYAELTAKDLETIVNILRNTLLQA